MTKPIRSSLVLAIAMLAAMRVYADAPTTQDVKRGAFEITFTQRSPLTDIKELTKRFGGKNPLDKDYDLGDVPFDVYVPSDYDPATPYGIVLYLGYKTSPVCPDDWKPVMDKTHTIYIVHSQHDDNPALQAAKIIDALFNMKKLYNIDDRRIYSVGFGADAVVLGVFFGDVVSKSIYVEPKYWRNVMLPGGSFLPAGLPHPTGAPLASAKTHRHVIVGGNDQPNFWTAMQKAFSQDGLTSTVIEVSREDFHFPHMTAPWLEQALAYLDAAPNAQAKISGETDVSARTGSSATKPTAAATVSDPQRMLNAAKSYISAGRSDLARTKLEAIVQQFPNDPAGAEAKTLLEQIKSAQ